MWGRAHWNSLAFTGSGSRSFIDANVTALGSVWVTGGTLVLPSGTSTILPVARTEITRR